ncbi:metacaspase-2 isoform X2 [Adelges cooleyi]|uniref:metacaspase-2 isoform X2 n=2 Tax=Adelges cooleyi TaxID=133065 RepID=UPI00217FAD24|nr:metacaspase-2 isoform X2 [Adelges cooleyi]
MSCYNEDQLIQHNNADYQDVPKIDPFLKCDEANVQELLLAHKTLIEKQRIERRNALSEANWDDNLKQAEVTKVAKNLTKNFSHSLNKKLYLYPEECLFLLEMKYLLLKWNGKILSIQNAYSLLLAENSGCTFDHFRTYSYLMKLGFRVFRYDKELHFNSYCEYNPQDLTKLKELPWKKKRGKDIFKNSLSKKNSSNSQFFPKCKTGWVTLNKPSNEFLPNTLQPLYDTYLFNLSLESNHSRIIEMICKNKNESIHTVNSLDHIKNSAYFPESVEQNGYLKYEENKPCNVKIFEGHNTMKRKYINDEDKTQQTKHIKIQINNSKCKISIDELYSFSRNQTKNNQTNATNLLQDDFVNNCLEPQNIQENNLTFINNANSDKLNVLSNILNENPNNELNLPDHINKKIFAVKPMNLEKNIPSTSDENYFHFDIYYPENDFPKINKPKPDFRV